MSDFSEMLESQIVIAFAPLPAVHLNQTSDFSASKRAWRKAWRPADAVRSDSSEDAAVESSDDGAPLHAAARRSEHMGRSDRSFVMCGDLARDAAASKSARNRRSFHFGISSEPESPELAPERLHERVRRRRRSRSTPRGEMEVGAEHVLRVHDTK